MIFTESYYRMIIHGISDIFRETSLPARLTGGEDYTGERGEMRMWHVFEHQLDDLLEEQP